MDEENIECEDLEDFKESVVKQEKGNTKATQ